MTSILIVEDDEQLRSAVARDLSHRGFDVTCVESVNEAVARLRDRRYDVLLTDLRMGDRDGIDLLAKLPHIAPQTPAILMSAFASARDHQRAVELGAVQVLCKPFTSHDLVHAIRQAVECETGFRGSLHGISLIDVLQMFHFARRSVCVTIGGRENGKVFVENGQIVHAVLDDVVGEEALRRILSMHSGSVRSGPLEGEERTISRSFEGLVLDMLRELDEEKQSNFLDFDDALAPVADALDVPKRPTDARDLCARVVSRVEGALRCCAVDLETGMLIGIHAVDDGKAAEAPEVLIADAIDLLRGSSLLRVEQVIGSELGLSDSPVNPYQEARVLSEDAWRLMLTTHGGRKAIVLDTRRDTSPGLAFWHLRACIPAFEREP